MSELVCIACGRSHPLQAARCGCGGALDPAEAGGPVDGERLDARGDRDAVFDLVDTEGWRIPLGEGDTPLVRDGTLGIDAKVEGANPTGSFKDRGASLLVGAARAFGARRVSEDSSGNAGAAVAAYAARAGLSCTVFSPEHVTEAKRAQMEELGAEVEVVEGPRSAVRDAAAEAGRAKDAYYASHTYPPWFVIGCSTLAFEILAQREEPPGTIVAPAAMGSVVLGLHRGLSRLQAGGAIDRLPRLVAVQAAGTDPIARRFDRGMEGDNRLADGLLVPQPPRLEQIVESLQATDGTALSVGEQATRAATEDLHRRGLLVEPSSATALAGVRRLREEGWLEADEKPVAVMTGAWTPR